MLSNIGLPGVILIVLFALIVFGPKRLPELGKSMGKTLREFKSATKGIMGDDETPVTVVAASSLIAQPSEVGSQTLVSRSDEVKTDKV